MVRLEERIRNVPFPSSPANKPPTPTSLEQMFLKLFNKKNTIRIIYFYSKCNPIFHKLLDNILRLLLIKQN